MNNIMNGSIYKITCLANNKVYIGQTIQPIQTRFNQHLSRARTGKSNHKLARAIRKYGEDNFIIEEIEVCTTQDLDNREKYWIQYYQSTLDNYGYNIKTGGQTNSQVYMLDNPEDIIQYYYQCHNQQQTCEHFGITDYKLRQLLTLNNLPTDYTNYGTYNSKSIYIYELQKEFASEKDCAVFLLEEGYTNCKSLDCVRTRLASNLKNYNKTYGLSVYFSNLSYQEFEEKYFDYIRKHSKKKIVCKTDKNKNVLKRYESAAAATKDMQGGAIYDAVKGNKGTHFSKGYYWYYETDL